jgi:shikimate kinase
LKRGLQSLLKTTDKNIDKNIVLTGVMGCGKSILGKLAAAKLNMPFTDLDEFIEARESVKIKEIFEKFGEKEFRKIESRAVAEVSGKTGRVIATGGGVILKKENIAALKQNGVIIYIYRPVELILKTLKETESRPLLKNSGLTDIFNARKSLYENSADYTVENIDLNSALKKIIEIYENRIA